MEKKKEKTKICNICKLGIDESKEFARFTHFIKKDKVLSEAFYHISCFREKVIGSKNLRELQQQAASILQFAKQNLGVPDLVRI